MTHNIAKTTKFILATAVGVAVGLITGATYGWLAAALTGWDVFVALLVILVLFDFARNSPDETAKAARSDAMSHSVVDALVLMTSLASLGAVIVLITSHDSGVLHIIFGLISILLSWVAVHMLFTLRYATLYYREVEGGIDFHDKLLKRPRFSDFAYLAFTVGMTYQVSDTEITDYKIRRTVLLQALISFVFGVVIIASTINFMFSLAR